MMKKKNVKKMITGALVILCVGTTTASSAVPIAYENILAADDLESPVIKSFQLDKTEVGPGDVIKVKAEVEDESGVERCFVYFTKDGRNVSFYLYPNDEGVLEGEITVDESWIDGTYSLFALSPVDSIGNTGNYYTFDSSFSTSFTVNGANSDDKGPVIKSFKIDKTEVGPGDVIKVKAEAEDESGVERCFVYFTKDGRNVSLYLYPNDEGVLEGEITVDSNWSNGTYVLFALSPSDTIGNTANYYSDSFDGNIDTKFIVNGNNDKIAPTITSFSIDKSEYEKWDTIYATSSATDETHNDHIDAVFKSEAGDIIEITLNTNGQENLTGETGIYGDKPDGKYMLKSLTAYDVVGNSKEYTPDNSDILKDIYFYVGDSHKYKQMNIKTGESQTITVPYYGNSFSMTSAGNSVVVENSNSSNVAITLTGVNVSSFGSYLTYQINGRSKGTSTVKFISRDTMELLDAYNVNVEQGNRNTVNTCKGAEVTFAVKHSTEGIHARIDEDASAWPVDISTNSTLINGEYISESRITYIFGSTGTYNVDVYDDNDALLKSYSVNVTEHIWDNGTITKEPTCLEDGVRTFICLNDGNHKRTETVPASGHDWNDFYTIDDEATCTKDGQKSIHCSVDNAIKEDSIELISAYGHNWDDGVITTDPTCTDSGIRIYTCQNDSSHHETENISSIGHKWGEWETVRAASEDEAGLRRRVCLNDPTHIESQVIQYAEEKIPASYEDVDNAIQEIPDLSLYTDESKTALQTILDSIIRDKTEEEQDIVDSYAKMIRNVIEQLEFKPADYSALDEVLKRIPSDEELFKYTDESVSALLAVKGNVEYDKKINEQDTVNKYADDIITAIENLVLVRSEEETGKDDTNTQDNIDDPDDTNTQDNIDNPHDTNKTEEKETPTDTIITNDDSEKKNETRTNAKDNETNQSIKPEEGDNESRKENNDNNNTHISSNEIVANDTHTSVQELETNKSTHTDNHVSASERMVATGVNTASYVSNNYTTEKHKATGSNIQKATPRTGDYNDTVLWAVCASLSAVAVCGIIIHIKKHYTKD